uniref:Uncharacterized protein n=1 Tax=Chromera velia CCMP2878 TaxID=1169474 RepID=A0A0G4G0G2_9ALVE|eukprot:Cvel_19533.t1-p1 / transcript=Cvel_19533.t1 / gene=Cvel_19533 / organism=Chromera_velia_CCMP2878 / gene_product=hypothetical protein / transcript_product=hypothetical protein / location=Cvel_scaffold1691:23900-25156(-) / protein_length=376 / sequence_SO=supercontig / SO=protein_coding / is_pseudo=false
MTSRFSLFAYALKVLSLLVVLFCCDLLHECDALRVRETDGDLLYLNFPVSLEKMRAFLDPKLEPETFKGTAWATAVIFKVTKLEMDTALGWVSLPSGSTLVKLQTYVKQGDKKGYLLMNLDFPSGISGWTQKIGCQQREKGASCGTSDTTRGSKGGNKRFEVVRCKEPYAFENFVEYEVTEEEEDKEFLEFVLSRPFKIEQEKKGGVKGTVVRVGAQEGKDDPSLIQGKRVKLTKLNWLQFQKKWPFLEVDETTMANTVAFLSDRLVFIDNEAEPVKNQILEGDEVVEVMWSVKPNLRGFTPSPVSIFEKGEEAPNPIGRIGLHEADAAEDTQDEARSKEGAETGEIVLEVEEEGNRVEDNQQIKVDTKFEVIQWL